MKSSILKILATLSLGVALGPLVRAQTRDTIRVTIPFDFTVGSKSLPAGEYQVRQTVPKVLAIEKADRSSAMVVMTNTAEPKEAPGVARLTFNKYGDRYFLSQVSSSDHGWQLPVSAAEKELRASKASPKPVVLIAGDK